MEQVLKNQPVEIQGERLVTSQAVAAGTVLFTQQPLASIPLPDIRRQRCNYCLRNVPLQCCSRCRSAYFCSNECFRNAWLHFHRVLCEPQEYDIYTNVDADRWLLERAALTLHSHIRLNKHHSHSPPHLLVAIQALHSLVLPKQGDTTMAEEDMAEVAKALEPFDCHFSIDELAALWQRIQLSRFDIHDHDQHMEPVAIGVYPLTALYVGHSCRPSAAAVYHQGAQVLIALHDMPAGAPVTICYVDLITTKSERTSLLQKRFGSDYVCHCSRCEGDYASLDVLLERSESLHITPEDAAAQLGEQLKSWSVLDMVKIYASGQDSNSPSRPLHVADLTHMVSRILSPDIYSLATDHRRNTTAFNMVTKDGKRAMAERILPAIDTLLQLPNVPGFSITMITEAQKMMRQLMAEDQWVEASRCALYLFVVYGLIYPLLHPVLAYHSLILARSCWNSLVQLEVAGIGRRMERIYENGVRTWINLSRETVLHTFGQECNLWREIVELQWVFERDQKLK